MNPDPHRRPNDPARLEGALPQNPPATGPPPRASTKALYDAQEYAACIAECRRVWQQEPHRRGYVRHHYAWSIYRSVIKSGQSPAQELDRALGAIAQLCPETGERDPLTFAAFQVADHHLRAASPRGASALAALRYLTLAQLCDRTETRGDKTFASPRERYVMLYSKALDKDGRYADCVSFLDEVFDSGLAFTGDNRHHCRYRQADCRLQIGQAEVALAALIDLEPFLRQGYVVMRTGDAYRALGQPAHARACYAAALTMTGDLSFGLPALAAYASDAALLGLDARLAGLHAWLANRVRAEKGWRALDFGGLDEQAAEAADLEPGPTIRDLRALWRTWATERYPESAGTVTGALPTGQLAFIQEFGTRETVVVRPQACGGTLPPKGVRVSFRKRRSYDRKKDRLGWEAIAVQVK